MYYVTMTDKFMSGWGYARNKINKLVISCETMEQAQTVYNNACNRPEMKYINIRSSKPYYNSYSYVTNYHGKDNGDNQDINADGLG